jgi:hypothetical protein
MSCLGAFADASTGPKLLLQLQQGTGISYAGKNLSAGGSAPVLSVRVPFWSSPFAQEHVQYYMLILEYRIIKFIVHKSSRLFEIQS